MSLEEILIAITAKYSELAVLVRQLIATKVEDTQTISNLSQQVVDKTEEVNQILASNESAKQLAGTLDANMNALVEEAKAAVPAEPTPVEPVV